MILKAREGYHAYRQMLRHYAVRNLLGWMQENTKATLNKMCKALSGPAERSWVNLGGQLVPEGEADRLRADIRTGKLTSWADVHKRYDELWAAYPLAKRRHALSVLLWLHGVKDLSPQVWRTALDQAILDQRHIRDQVYASRKKDYDDPFRRVTFRNDEEMRAVLGSAEDNSFVQQVRQETDEFEKLVEAVRRRG